METAAAHELLDVVSGPGAPVDRLTALRSLRSHLDACEVEITRAMTASGVSCPEQVIGHATRVGRRGAQRVVRRAELLGAHPEIGDALAAGVVTAGHVDALAKAFDACEPDEETAFAAEVPRLLTMAGDIPVDRFGGAVGAALREVRRRSDIEVLAAEVRQNRLSLWQERVTGRWRLSASFDAASGTLLSQRLTAAMRGVEAGASAPSDPLERASWRLAHGLLTLTEHGTRQRPVLVVDERAKRRVYDWGAANAVPDDLTELLVQYAKPVVVVLRPDGSIANAAAFDLGRTQRLPSRKQRLVLTGLSATCVIPGCDVPADQCEVHHVVPWSEGGRTDLDNEVLMCRHDHDRHHAEGWDMHLAPDRTLTITYPDGTVTISRPAIREPP